MKTLLFSTNSDTIDEFQKRDNSIIAYYDIDSLYIAIDKEEDNYILIIDYNSVATEFNRLISSNTLPKNIIVLERAPEIITGKMLISKKVRAYGNAKMSQIHYNKMIQTVRDSKVWTYPQLTAALVDIPADKQLSSDSKSLIKNRLTSKEEEVIYLVLDGLTNDAIASSLAITARTVKAHVSSIFSKLHVNDRVSLILLLK